MRRKFLVFNTLGLMLFFACNNVSKPNFNSKQAQYVNDSLADRIALKSGFETYQLSNDEIKSVFTLAIKDYIETVSKKDKIPLDTLYFGKHVYGQADDFPDIELPIAIANTQIRLISPEEGTQMQQANKNKFYINMMGWVDKVNASFILVTFSNGAKHQYDYFIDYNFNSTEKQYELSSIAIEDYRALINNKPKRISLFNNGKYRI